MDIGFVRGFGYAIAWLKKWHGLGSEIEELYRHTGIPLAEFEKYCDEYDLPSIREVAGAAATRGRPTAQPPTCQVQQNRRQRGKGADVDKPARNRPTTPCSNCGDFAFIGNNYCRGDT